MSKESIEAFLNKVEADIKQVQYKKGIIASGNSANSLRYTVTSTKGVLYGVNYFQQQDQGRKPGTMPPVMPIYEWLGLRKYGLSYETDQQRKSLAFAIAKNMQKRGTTIFRNKKKGLELSKIIEENKKEFYEGLAEKTKKDYIVKIRKEL